MIDLENSQITQILPDILKNDAEVAAISYAIHMQMIDIIKYSKRISVYASVDELPEDIVDLLAVESRSQYYKEDLELSRKREIVKKTLLWYHKAGTPAAVQELMEAVFGEGEVIEWFDYGADPYKFKVKTNATMTPNINEEFSALIKQVKNARSHIDSIEIEREIDQALYCGTTEHSQYKNAAVIDGYQENREATSEQYTGAASFSATKPPAIIDGYNVQREAKGDTYIGAEEFNNSRPAAIIDGFETDAATVEEANYIGLGVSCQYKNQTIRE